MTPAMVFAQDLGPWAALAVGGAVTLVTVAGIAAWLYLSRGRPTDGGS